MVYYFVSFCYNSSSPFFHWIKVNRSIFPLKFCLKVSVNVEETSTVLKKSLHEGFLGIVLSCSSSNGHHPIHFNSLWSLKNHQPYPGFKSFKFQELSLLSFVEKYWEEFLAGACISAHDCPNIHPALPSFIWAWGLKCQPQRERTSQERNSCSSALQIVDRMVWRAILALAMQPHLDFQCTDRIP